ncbi:hypothetical protein HYZ97_03810 [Candidatus Pacearchaeota archaeon]|nr:hypothetical protein [Candidatus Pacearchaeota archaeon]
MVVETIFSGPLGQTILVFILVFTLVFAVLQKTKILGDGKKQSDALIALAIGLLVISVASAMDLITKLIPFLAVSLVIIMVFLLLVGFFFKDFSSPDWVTKGAPFAALIVIAIAVMYFTDSFGYLYDLFSGGSALLGNLLLIVIAVGAVLLAWFGSKSSSSGSGKSS